MQFEIKCTLLSRKIWRPVQTSPKSTCIFQPRGGEEESQADNQNATGNLKKKKNYVKYNFLGFFNGNNNWRNKSIWSNLETESSKNPSEKS